MTRKQNSDVLVTFWGTRGSTPTPGHSTEKYGGNTPCVTVEYEGTRIVLDAGTGIRNLGIEMAKAGRPQDVHLFLSHTHWDHIQGLPFFAPAYMKGMRLSVYGSPNKEGFLSSILADQMDLNYFPVDMGAFEAEVSINELSRSKLKIGGITVVWQEQMRHPGGCVRYSVSAGSKKIVYATDVELDTLLKKSRSKRVQAENRQLLREYLDFVSHADLLIADGQYTEEQYVQKAGWGHTSIPVITELAHKAHVKQLAIFSHEPVNSDAHLDELWMEHHPRYMGRRRSMNVFWSREGMMLAV